MSEFSAYGGGRMPHDPAVQAEHEDEVREEVESSRDAAEAARGNATRPRPWWAFWRPRRRAR